MRLIVYFDVSYHKQSFLKLTNCHKEILLTMTFSTPNIVSGGYLFIRLSFYLESYAMKMNVCGVQRIAGTSKAGSPFDMAQLLALVPIENVAGKVNVTGAGFKVMEVPLDQAALPHFIGLKFPVQLDLATDVRPARGQLETVVVGIVPAKTAA